MSFTKFVGTFLQATLFGGTYDDVAFEVRVLKGEVARLHERLDKEFVRLQERLDELDGGKGSGAKGKSRLRIMSAAEAADVPTTSDKLDAATADDPAERAPASRRADMDAGDLAIVPTSRVFSPEMPIAMAWAAHPDAPQVFAQHHLPGCIDCALSSEESIADGAALHSLDATTLLADLERLVTA